MNRSSSRARLAALAAAIATLGLLSAAPATAASTGLSGVVTGSDGALVAACVSVFDAGYVNVDSVCTDSGRWELPAVPDGEGYRVFVEPQWNAGPYLAEWADDARDFESATPVAAPSTVDVELAVGAVLQGTMTDASGQPAANVSVEAVDATTGESASMFGAVTDMAGQWQLIVRPGEVHVSFNDWPHYQWAVHQRSLDTATVFTVAPRTTTTIDDSWIASATVRGQVTDAVNGRPLPGVEVSLIDPRTFDTENNSFGWATTDARGRYTITTDVEGKYALKFGDTANRYITEFSGHTRIAKKAATFLVKGGKTTYQSTSLTLGGVVTGRVVNSATGTGLPDVCPTAYVWRTDRWVVGAGGTCSDRYGRYSITGLPTGTITVVLEASRSDMAPTWYRNSETQAGAQLVSVTAGHTTSLKHMWLAPGGVVSGTVTAPDGHPVEGAIVDLNGRFGGRAGGCENPLCTTTDAQGHYDIHAPAGTYRPIIYSYRSEEYAPEWSGDADSYDTATPVTVTKGRTTTVDAQMAQGAHVSGHAVLADGTPSPSYQLGSVYTTSGAYIGNFDAYDAEGSFRSSPLPPGTYVLRATNADTNVDTWYDGAATQDQATVVTLSRGEERTITFHVR